MRLKAVHWFGVYDLLTTYAVPCWASLLLSLCLSSLPYRVNNVGSGSGHSYKASHVLNVVHWMQISVGVTIVNNRP